MKKKIAILGSTGSIGKTLLKIVEKNISNFEVVLLTANKDYSTLLKQSKKFKVKNLIISDEKSFKILKNKNYNKNIKIFNSFEKLNKVFTSKIDYVMSSIVGINGLLPTLNIIKYTKKIAIANKESIICGWRILERELQRRKTLFVPVDSEHFSLWYGIQNININSVEKFYLTASGGPLYKTPLKNFKNISVDNALNHPNWRMGKKISIDSATMINKVFEVIEAKNIFKISYKNIDVLIHPKSYVHGIIKFQNGMIKVVAHETTMKIPIFNTLFPEKKKIYSKSINLKKLNNLDFQKVNFKKYPMMKLLKKLPNKNSLFETVLVSANDTLVELFLDKKIKYMDISYMLLKFVSTKEFIKYRNYYPKKVDDIIKLNNYVRLKILKNVYKSKNV